MICPATLSISKNSFFDWLQKMSVALAARLELGIRVVFANPRGGVDWIGGNANAPTRALC